MKKSGSILLVGGLVIIVTMILGVSTNVSYKCFKVLLDNQRFYYFYRVLFWVAVALIVLGIFFLILTECCEIMCKKKTEDKSKEKSEQSLLVMYLRYKEKNKGREININDYKITKKENTNSPDEKNNKKRFCVCRNKKQIK